MTTPAEHYVVSEWSRTETHHPPGSKFATDVWKEPDGECHAVAPGSPVTVCELDVDEFVAFRDQPWNRGILKRCHVCQDVVPND